MLEIQTVSWRNFLSYGDYETVIDIESLGQCLITGEVIGEDKNVYSDGNPAQGKRSNGAGKSVIPNAILWALFGRTMHSASPGDKVLNWFTGKNCHVQIDFKNGDRIIRTRNTAGGNELLFIKDGDEHTSTADTLSTTKAQQAQLNQSFKLDWDLFCGSAFFNQYSKPWMEMADTTRKKAIERALHVDRLTYYAKVAKAKATKLDETVTQKRDRIQTLNGDITRLKSEIERLEAASANFEENKKSRQREALTRAVQEKEKRDNIKLPDLEKVAAKWKVVNQVQKSIDAQNKQANAILTQIAEHEGLETSQTKLIKSWMEKSGKMCTACEREIDENHVSTKLKPIALERQNLRQALEDLQNTHNKTANKIVAAEQALASKKPPLTNEAAAELHKKRDRHSNEIQRLKQLAKDIGEELDPHQEAITVTEQKIAEYEAEIVTIEKDIERFEFQNRHYTYIYKSYNDRSKIKSFIFQDHVPYINSRLKHYLDVFGLDIQIELTPALGITSNMGSYEFESGGERKRTDVAFMLAMYDFHEELYGRQSNILVLDEVDGRLDDDGIDSLISIIKNDLSSKAETIIVISHRNLMFDVFPRELHIKRVASEGFRGFSQLEAA